MATNQTAAEKNWKAIASRDILPQRGGNGFFVKILESKGLAPARPRNRAKRDKPSYDFLH